MSSTLEFTGERFVPGVPGEIELEHVHRYAFARRLVAGRRVLDVACGEGYGSALLATAAASVAGVDIDGATLAHARVTYAALGNVAFHQASAAALPFADASFDAIVSFETIEHLPQELQPAMLAEFARVLAPRGIVMLSAPNRVEYSEKRGYVNAFHAHEHDRAELDALLARHFAARRFHRQRVWLGSTIWRDDVAAPRDSDAFEGMTGDTHDVQPLAPPPAMYYVVVAARAPEDLPAGGPMLSLFGDRDGAELARLEAQGGELVRIDGHLREYTDEVGRKTAHVEHLERLVAERERRIAERDDELQRRSTENAALVAERDALAVRAADAQRLEAAVAAQERIIDYRQSARWWLMLPWIRLRAAWRRLAG